MTRMPQIAVLAGGLATRMRPLTERLPKALLEVAGEPFIAHQLRLFARQGIKDVKLLVGYRWEQIEVFVAMGAGLACTSITLPTGQLRSALGGPFATLSSVWDPNFS